ncbi:MAG: PilZ domain-containing protein [Candidatus Omnitrophota bacterium]
MGEVSGSSDKRVNPRITRNFVIRFRQSRTEHAANWETSVIKNISQGGCCFATSVSYLIGQVLELEVQLPSMNVPIKFLGEVRRCQYMEVVRDITAYMVAVRFQEIDPAQKKILVDTVDFFVQKQKNR